MTRKTAKAAPPEPKGQRRPVATDFPKLFDLIAANKSMRGACEELGIHRPSTEAVIDADPVLSVQYARARELRGETVAEQVMTVAAGVLNGRVRPDAGRVAIDAYKWAAGQMAPKKWGQQTVKTEVSNADGQPFQVKTEADAAFSVLASALGEAVARKASRASSKG